MRFLELKKHLKKNFGGLRKIRIAVMGDSATQFLCQALRGYGFELGLSLEIFESDYNQIAQQITNRSSDLYEFRPEVIVIFRSTAKLRKEFYKLEGQARSEFCNAELNEIRGWLDAIEGNGCLAKVVVLNFPSGLDQVFGHFGNKTALSFAYQVRKLNLGLMELSHARPNLFITDLAALHDHSGEILAADPRNYVEGDVVFSLEFWPVVAKGIVDVVQSFSGIFKKCLILDLDNTLWGGVIGDDGLSGIEIGDLRQGKAFSELQSWAKQLKRRGVLLAVCSKNEEKNAKEPFDRHPQMILRLEDIAVFVANWESKVDNIKYIKEFLNIGYDSMVFIDDNAFERNLVRSCLPAVCVPELPSDPADYLPFLTAQNLFETSSITEEDSHRTSQFHAEARRRETQRTFTSEAEFLESLGMTSSIGPFSDFDIPRIAQLIQRSNQFNLRVERYTEADVKRIARSPEHRTFSISLADKFGEHGLISVVIVEKRGSSFFIDTWIMSCRVLRRGVENLVLNSLAAVAQAEGVTEIVGEYRQTEKNVLVKDHYSKLGFVGSDNFWTLALRGFSKREHFIAVST